MSAPPKISRRALTLGGIAAAGTAVIAGAVYEVPRLLRRHARGQYADLVNRLGDPEQAAIVGRAMLPRTAPTKDDFDKLRAATAGRPFADLIAADATDGHLSEVQGWVLPATLAKLCILAAQSL